MKIKEIAHILHGSVVGDGEVVIERLSPIEEAGAGDLTFIANPQYLRQLETTRADAILVRPGTECPGKNLIIVGDPYVALGKLLAIFCPEESHSPGISSRAVVEEGADISPEATIYSGVTVCQGARIRRGAVLYPGVFVGRDVSIDEDSILYPNVCVYRKCIIGKRVILHAGVVVGGDGFGYANPGADNLKIPQVGIVQIDEDVEIGSNSTIDRATLGKTWIKRGVKIDNLVQIAHNVVIGEDSVIVAQVGISGSTKLGKSVIIGGQAGLVGHITIGDRVMIGAKSGVHENISSGMTVSGSPHLPHKIWLRVVASMAKLPEMRHMLSLLTTRVNKLEEECKIIDPS
jgi:UDP-3-O-[3-hydroxymyristoyl] glucosamine N-acyltransferase